jgi:hypothetical protein
MFKDHKHAISLQKKLKKLSTAKEIFDEVEKEFSFMKKPLDPELKDIVINNITKIINAVGGIEQKKKEEEERKKKELEAKKLIPQNTEEEFEEEEEEEFEEEEEEEEENL